MTDMQITYQHTGSSGPDSRPVTVARPTRTLTGSDVVVAAGMLSIAGAAVSSEWSPDRNELTVEFVNGLLDLDQREAVLATAIRTGAYGRSPDIAVGMSSIRKVMFG